MNVETAARTAFANLFEQERTAGRAEGLSQVALRMLREHMPVDMITKFTDMSTEKIMEMARSAGLNPAT